MVVQVIRYLIMVGMFIFLIIVWDRLVGLWVVINCSMWFLVVLLVCLLFGKLLYSGIWDLILIF